MNGRRIWYRALIVLGVGVLVVVAVGVFRVGSVGIGALWDLRSAARSLKRELEQARREGLPLEPSDLRRDPPVPPERNAAPFIARMAALHAGMPGAETRKTADVLKALSNPARTDADRKAARELLRGRAEYLRLAEKAASLPDCDMAKPYERGVEVEFKEFAGCREAVRLLAIRAVLATDAGDYRSAFQDLARGARISRHVAREPVIMALLVRTAMDAILERTFAAIVLDHMLKPEAVRQARKTLSDLGDPSDIEYACRGELVMARATVNLMRKGMNLDTLAGDETSKRFAPMLPGKAPGSVFYDAWEARIVGYWRRVFERLRAHRGDYMAQGAAFRELNREIEEAVDARKPSYILLVIMAPVFEGLGDKVAGMEARRRLSDGLVRIAEYRLQKGSFPATLADAGGPPLLDPFTGKPLRYRRTDRGFVLYSVGEDRKDNGGDGRLPPSGGPAPDIVIEHPRAGE